MNNWKKMVSIILCSALIMSTNGMITLASSISEQISESGNKIEEQLKEDSGEEKAKDVLGVDKNNQNKNDVNIDALEKDDNINTTLSNINNEDAKEDAEIIDNNEYIEELEENEGKNDTNTNNNSVDDNTNIDSIDDEEINEYENEPEEEVGDDKNILNDVTEEKIFDNEIEHEEDIATCSESSGVEDNIEIDNEVASCSESNCDFENEDVIDCNEIASVSESKLLTLGSPPIVEHILPNNWFNVTGLPKSTVSVISIQKGGAEPSGTSWDIDSSTNLKVYYENYNAVIYVSNIDDVIYTAENSIGMFASFTNLIEINGIEFLDTSNTTNMMGMFEDCKKLQELNLSTFNTSNVTNMQRMFQNCLLLTSINLSGFDTSLVENMEYMFNLGEGSVLTDLDLSDFETSNVNDMGCIFTDCTNLINLNIENFDTSNVTDMTYMFKGCKNIENINVSNFNTSKVTSMEGLFQGCENLLSINVNNFDTSNVGNMTYMFRDCKKLVNINVSNFNTSKVIYMTGLFQGCENLKSANLRNFDTPKLIDTLYMFSGCKKITSIDFGDFNTKKVRGFDRMFYNCEELTSLDLSSFVTESANSASYMFYNCKKLKKIYVSNKFNKNDFSNSNLMFHNCVTLEGALGTKLSNFSGDGNAQIDATHANIDKPSYRGYFSTKSFTVTFNMNGHGTQVPSQTVISHENVIKPASPSESGFVFEGWYKEVQCLNMWFFDNDVVNANKTLYAKWSVDSVYNITYNLNGGEWNSFTPVMSRYYSQSVILPNNTKIKKVGYDFVGWYEDSECVGVQVLSIPQYTIGDKTYYAKWNIKHFNINFDTDGGDTIPTQVVEYNNKVIEPPVPSKSGFVFINWYTENSPFTNVYNFNTNVTSAFTLYARFVSEAQVKKVIFDSNGGSIVATQNVVIGEKATRPANPTKNGYSFVDWYIDNGFSTIFDFNTNISDDIVLYAKWNQNHPYNPGGGSSGGGGGNGGGSGFIDDVNIKKYKIPVTYINTNKSDYNYIFESNNVIWNYNPLLNTWGMDIVNNISGNVIYGFVTIVTYNQNSYGKKSIIKTETYFVGENGFIISGWLHTLDNNWYFFDTDRNVFGTMIVNSWKNIEGDWYYFGLDGRMYSNAITPDGHYVDKEGRWIDLTY